MKKPHLRRYDQVRPTEVDADEDGFVMRVDDLFEADLTNWENIHRCSHWCRVDEWQDHLQSLINGDTDDAESGWVYAKDRWPTEDDGEFVLWMADSWSRPQVSPFLCFNQRSHAYKYNLRWHRLPPEPPKKPRELPSVAPTEFPAFVTLRDGSHAIVHGRHPDEQSTTLLGGIVNELRTLALDCPHWYADTGKAHSDPKKLNPNDIVYVGGWLSAAELEALKNGI